MRHGVGRGRRRHGGEHLPDERPERRDRGGQVGVHPGRELPGRPAAGRRLRRPERREDAARRPAAPPAARGRHLIGARSPLHSAGAPPRPMDPLLSRIRGDIEALAQLEAEISVTEVTLFLHLVSDLDEAIEGYFDGMESQDRLPLVKIIPHLLELYLGSDYDPSNSICCGEKLINIISNIIPRFNNLRDKELISSVVYFLDNFQKYLCNNVPESCRDSFKHCFIEKLLSQSIVNSIILEISSFSENVYEEWYIVLPLYFNLISSYVSYRDVGWVDENCDIDLLICIAETLDVSVQITPCKSISEIEHEIDLIYEYLNVLADNIKKWKGRNIPSKTIPIIFYSNLNLFINNLVNNGNCTNIMKLISVDLTSMLCSHLLELLGKNKEDNMEVKFLLDECTEVIKNMFGQMVDENLGKDNVYKYNNIFSFISNYCDPSDTYKKLISKSKEWNNENERNLNTLEFIDRDKSDNDTNNFVTTLEKLDCFINNIKSMNRRQILYVCKNLNPFEKMNALSFKILVEVGYNIFEPLAVKYKKCFEEITEEKNEKILGLEIIDENLRSLKNIFFALLAIACELKPIEDYEKCLNGNVDTKDGNIVSKFCKINVDRKTVERIQKTFLENLRSLPESLNKEVINFLIVIMKLGMCIKFCFNYLKQSCLKERHDYLDVARNKRFSIAGEVIRAVYDMAKNDIEKHNSLSIDTQILQTYFDTFKTFFRHKNDFENICNLKVDKKIVKVCFIDNSNSYQRLNMFISNVMWLENSKNFMEILKVFVIETHNLLYNNRRVDLDSDAQNFLIQISEKLQLFDSTANSNCSLSVSEKNNMVDEDNNNNGIIIHDKLNFYKTNNYRKLFNNIEIFHEKNKKTRILLSNLINIIIPIGFVYFSFRRKISSKSIKLEEMKTAQHNYITIIKNLLYQFSGSNTFIANISCVVKCVMNIIFAIWTNMASLYVRSGSFEESREFAIEEISFGLKLLTSINSSIVPFYCYNSFCKGENNLTRFKEKNRVYAIVQNAVNKGFCSGRINCSETIYAVEGSENDKFGHRFVKILFRRLRDSTVPFDRKLILNAFSDGSIIPMGNNYHYNQDISFSKFKKRFVIFYNYKYDCRMSIVSFVYDKNDATSKNSFLNIISNILNGDEIKYFSLSMFRLLALLYEHKFSQGIEADTCERFISSLNKFSLSLPLSHIFYAKLYNNIISLNQINNSENLLKLIENLKDFMETRYKFSENFNSSLKSSDLTIHNEILTNSIGSLMKYRTYILELRVLLTALVSDGYRYKIDLSVIIPYLMHLLKTLSNDYSIANDELYSVKQQMGPVQNSDKKRKEILIEYKISQIDEIEKMVYSLIFKYSKIHKINYTCEDDNKDNGNNILCLKKEVICDCKKIIENKANGSIMALFKKFNLGLYSEKTNDCFVNFDSFNLIMNTIFIDLINTLMYDNELDKLDTKEKIREYVLNNMRYRYPLIVLYSLSHTIKHLKILHSNSENIIRNIKDDVNKILDPNKITGISELGEFIGKIKNRKSRTKLESLLRVYIEILNISNIVDSKNKKYNEEINKITSSIVLNTIMSENICNSMEKFDTNLKKFINFVDATVYLEQREFYDLKSAIELNYNTIDENEQQTVSGTNRLDSSKPVSHFEVLSLILNNTSKIIVWIIKYFEKSNGDEKDELMINESSNFNSSSVVISLKYSMNLACSYLNDYPSKDLPKDTLVSISTYLGNLIDLEEFLKNYFIDSKLFAVNYVNGRNEINNVQYMEDIYLDNFGRSLRIDLSSNLIDILKNLTTTINLLSKVSDTLTKDPNIINSEETLNEYMIKCFKKEIEAFNEYYLVKHPNCVSGIDGVKDKNFQDKKCGEIQDALSQFSGINYLDDDSLLKSNTNDGKYVGLKNFNQTCYINCIIQQLFFNKSLRSVISEAYELYKILPESSDFKKFNGNNNEDSDGSIHKKIISDSDGCNTLENIKFFDSSDKNNTNINEGNCGITNEKQVCKQDVELIGLIGGFFKQMETHTSDSIDTEYLCRKLESLNISDKAGRQSDAMEFFCNIIDGLFDQIRIIMDATKYDNPFMFKKVERLELSCGHYRQTVEDLINIQINLILYAEKRKNAFGVPIKKTMDIQDVIWLMSNPVPEDNSNGGRYYECFSVGCKGDYIDESGKPKSKLLSTSERMHDCPKTLVLFIPRIEQNYSDDWNNWINLKINKVIDIGPILDMSSKDENSAKHEIYTLSGIVAHTGTNYFGHYVSYCREKQEEENDLGNNTNEEVELNKLNEFVERSQWYKFSDDVVSREDPRNMFEKLKKGFSKSSKSGRMEDVKHNNNNDNNGFDDRIETYACVHGGLLPCILFYDRVMVKIKNQNEQNTILEKDKSIIVQENEKNINGDTHSEIEKNGNGRVLDMDVVDEEFQKAIKGSEVYISLLKDNITFVSEENLEKQMYKLINNVFKITVEHNNGEKVKIDEKHLESIVNELLLITGNLEHICDFRLIKKYVIISMYKFRQTRNVKLIKPSESEAHLCVRKFCNILVFTLCSLNPENSMLWKKFNINKIMSLLIIATVIFIESLTYHYYQIPELILTGLGIYRNISAVDLNEKYFEKIEKWSSALYSTIIQNWILQEDKRYNNTIGTILYTILSKPRELILEYLNQSEMVSANDCNFPSENITHDIMLKISGVISRTNSLLIDLLLPVDINKYYTSLRNSHTLNNLVITFSAFDSDIICYNSMVYIRRREKNINLEIDSIESENVTCSQDKSIRNKLSEGDMIPITPIFYYLGHFVSYFVDIIVTMLCEDKSNEVVSQSAIKKLFYKPIKNEKTRYKQFRRLDIVLNDNINNFDDHIEKTYDITFPRHPFVFNLHESIISLILTSILYGYPGVKSETRMMFIESNNLRIPGITSYEEHEQYEFIGSMLSTILGSNSGFFYHKSYIAELLVTIYNLTMILGPLNERVEKSQLKYLFSYYTPSCIDHLTALISTYATYLNPEFFLSTLNFNYKFNSTDNYLHTFYKIATRYIFKKYGIFEIDDSQDLSIWNVKIPKYMFPDDIYDYRFEKADLWVLCLDKNQYKKTAYSVASNIIQSILFSIFNHKALLENNSIKRRDSEDIISQLLTHNLCSSRTFVYLTKELLKSQLPEDFFSSDLVTIESRIKIVCETLRDLTIMPEVRNMLLELLDALLRRMKSFGNVHEKYSKIIKEVSRSVIQPVEFYSNLYKNQTSIASFKSRMFPGLPDNYQKISDSIIYSYFYRISCIEKYKFNHAIYNYKKHENRNYFDEKGYLQRELMIDMITLLMANLENNNCINRKGENYNSLFLSENVLDIYKSKPYYNKILFSIKITNDEENEGTCTGLYKLPDFTESIINQCIFRIEKLKDKFKDRVDIDAIIGLMEFLYLYDIHSWLFTNVLGEIEKRVITFSQDYNSGKDVLNSGKTLLQNIEEFIKTLEEDGLLDILSNLNIFIGEKSDSRKTSPFSVFLHVLLIIQSLSVIQKVLNLIKLIVVKDDFLDDVHIIIGNIINLSLKYYECYHYITLAEPLKSIVETLNREGKGAFTINLDEDIVYILLKDVLETSFKMAKRKENLETVSYNVYEENQNFNIRYDSNLIDSMLSLITSYLKEHNLFLFNSINNILSNNGNDRDDNDKNVIISTNDSLSSTKYELMNLFVGLLNLEDVLHALENEKTMTISNIEAIIYINTQLLKTLIECKTNIDIYSFFVQILIKTTSIIFSIMKHDYYFNYPDNFKTSCEKQRYLSELVYSQFFMALIIRNEIMNMNPESGSRHKFPRQYLEILETFTCNIFSKFIEKILFKNLIDDEEKSTILETLLTSDIGKTFDNTIICFDSSYFVDFFSFCLVNSKFRWTWMDKMDSFREEHVKCLFKKVTACSRSIEKMFSSASEEHRTRENANGILNKNCDETINNDEILRDLDKEQNERESSSSAYSSTQSNDEISDYFEFID